MSALAFPMNVRPFVPNPVTVRYRSVAKGRPDVVVDVPDATLGSVKQAPPSKGGFGTVKQGDVLAALGYAALAGVICKPGDKFEPQAGVYLGRTFTVVEATPGVALAQWRVAGRDFVVEFALRDRVQFWRSATQTDDAGRQLKRYAKFTDWIPCRDQPAGGSMTEEFGRVKIEALRTLIVPDNLPDVRSDDQARMEDGRILEITGVDDPESFEDPVSLACVDREARWD